MSTPTQPTEADRELALAIVESLYPDIGHPLEDYPGTRERKANRIVALISAHVTQAIEDYFSDTFTRQPRSRPAIGSNGGETDAGRYGTSTSEI